MKIVKIIIMSLILNLSMAHAVPCSELLCECCPVFCGFSPIFITAGRDYLEKANNVEKARAFKEATSNNLEEGIALHDERLPHGHWFPATYVPFRRAQGYTCITIGTMMSASALYSTGSLVCAFNTTYQKRRME